MNKTNKVHVIIKIKPTKAINQYQLTETFTLFRRKKKRPLIYERIFLLGFPICIGLPFLFIAAGRRSFDKNANANRARHRTAGMFGLSSGRILHGSGIHRGVLLRPVIKTMVICGHVIGRCVSTRKCKLKIIDVIFCNYVCESRFTNQRYEILLYLCFLC